MAEEFSLSAKISGDTSELNEALGAGKESLKEFGVDVDKVIQFLTNPTIGLAAAFSLVAVKGIEAAKEFDEVGAKLGKMTGETGEALDGLKNSLNNVVSAGVVQGVKDVGDAIGMLHIRLGLAGEDLEKATMQFSAFADVTDQDVSGAVTDVTKLMAQWNIPASDLAITLDKLTVTTQLTGVQASALTQMLTQAGPIFKSAGLDIDEAAGLMIGFSKAGVEAGDATQGINAALRKFANEGVKDSGAALASLIQEIQTTPDKSRAATLAVENFGRTGVKMGDAIRSGALDIKEWTKQIQNAQGALEKTDAATESFEDVTAKLGGQLQGLLAESFKSILEAVKPFVQILSSLISAFEALPGPIKQTVTMAGILVGGLNVAKLAMVAFGVSANAALGPIGLIIGAIGLLVTGVQAGVAAYNEYNAALKTNVGLSADNALEAKNVFTETEKLSTSQTVNAEQVAKLVKLYPELDKVLKEGVTSTRDAAIETEKVAEAHRKLALQMALEQNTSQKKSALLDIDSIKKDLKSGSQAFKEYQETIKDLQSAIAKETNANDKARLQSILQTKLAAVAEMQSEGTSLKAELQKRQGDLVKYEEEAKKLKEQSLIGAKAYEAQQAALRASYQKSAVEETKQSGKVLTDAEKKAAEDRLKVQLELDAKNREIAKKWLEDHGVMVQMGSAFEVNEREKWLLKEEQFAEKDIALWTNAIETVGQTVSASFTQTGSTFSSLSKLVNTLSSNIKTGVKDIGQFVSEMATQVSNSVNSIFGAIQKGYQQTLQAQQAALDKEDAANKKALAKEQAQIDKDTKAKLKALGLEEKTTLEKDQAELESAIATGDAIAIKAAEDQLLKDQILQQGVEAKEAAAQREAKAAEELERKKSDLAYKSAHAQWELQGVQLAAASALAIMQLWAGTGTYVEKIVMSAVVGAIGIAEGVILAANEPKRASYAAGTYNSIGGAANLAEQGPELVINPSVHNLAQGSTVLNAAQTAKIMSRKGATINVNVGKATHGTVGEIARTVNMEARKLAFAGVL